MRKLIFYDDILENTRNIINALEYDCMRSGGKVKFNVATLNELYKLEERLEAKLAEKTTKNKPTPISKAKEKLK